MNIGNIVGLVEVVDGVLTKAPAIVTKLYHNVHDEVVADLHKLEATHHAVIVAEENPQEALPVGGIHATTDLSPVTEEDKQAAAQLAPPAAPAPAAAAPSPALSAEESAYSQMSAEDQAAFQEFLASRSEAGTAGASETAAGGAPSTGTGESTSSGGSASTAATGEGAPS